MKVLVRIASLSVFLFCFANQILAQDFILKQSNNTGIYKKGETIRIKACPVRAIQDTLFIKILKNNNQVILEKRLVSFNDTMVIFEGSFREPCSVIAEAIVGNAKQSAGLIVDPQKIKPGIASPKDLDEYWEGEKRALQLLKMEVKLEKAKIEELGFECFDTEINCIGPKPARGYFAKPSGAGVRSLPILILVHAAGVKGAWCRSEARDAIRYAQMSNGALCFDLNAHGMLNGKSDEYYADLENGELKDYYIKGLENRDDLYFRGMYLRLLRTIEFMTRQPEWDGKRILVIGESQGGGQALAAAGLDSRVSAVVATVPAMCDWGGTLVNHKGGWPQSFERAGDKGKMKNILPYFDVAHLLRNSKAIFVVEIGLIDQTCPSTSVYAAINQAKGKKIIYPVTYREHSWPNELQRKIWDKEVFEPKNAFVENYLK